MSEEPKLLTSEELKLLGDIEQWACVCDMQLAYTCGVHDMIYTLRNIIVDIAIDNVDRTLELTEELSHLTATLEDIRYKIDMAFDAY